TLPATQLGHTIHFGHGRPRFVASRTTILPGRTCASLPSVGRRTFFYCPAHGGRNADVAQVSAPWHPHATRVARVLVDGEGDTASRRPAQRVRRGATIRAWTTSTRADRSTPTCNAHSRACHSPCATTQCSRASCAASPSPVISRSTCSHRGRR